MENFKIQIEIKPCIVFTNDKLLKIVTFYNCLYNCCFNVDFYYGKTNMGIAKTVILLEKVEV